KTSSARILAKSINCDQGLTVTPCLTCPSCHSIAESSTTSVFEIDAASNNSVDDARSLIERAPLATQDGKHKLYIIDECHMLTKEAFNALLKTIEEPPPNVVFILATTEEHKVPPTIVSRCQRLMFRLVKQDDLVKHLASVAEKENIEITPEALELMTRRSGGGLRDALGLLDQASLLCQPGEPVKVSDLLVLLGALDEDILLAISEGVRTGSGNEVLLKVNELLMHGREPALIATELARHFLNLTKASYLSPAEVDRQQLISGSRDYVARLVEQASSYDRSELSQIVERLDGMEGSIKRSSQPSLTLEMGLLSICHRHDIASIKALNARIDELSRDLDAEIHPEHVRHETKPAPPPQRPQPHKSRPEPAPIEEIRKEEIQTVPEREPEPQSEPIPEQNPEPGPAALESYESPNEVEEEEDEAPAVRPAGATEIEELWSDLLDCLHKTSIPAYSLVSMHAFPVSLENDQLTLGVNKEFFQKSIEGKSQHLISAYRSLTGKEIAIKVKVTTEVAPSKKKPDLRDEDPPSRAPAPGGGGGTVTTVERSTGERATATVERTATAVKEAEPPLKTEPARHIPEPDSGSSIIKEAYRIFEGPGSRLIG
ncbi:MAG: DNA polymerase III subunit gamma/tau, partial [Candidatus Obscuribacterales bacterium]